MSLDISCSLSLSFLQALLSKTVRSSEKIQSANKYPGIFSLFSYCIFPFSVHESSDLKSNDVL